MADSTTYWKWKEHDDKVRKDRAAARKKMGSPLKIGRPPGAAMGLNRKPKPVTLPVIKSLRGEQT